MYRKFLLIAVSLLCLSAGNAQQPNQQKKPTADSLVITKPISPAENAARKKAFLKSSYIAVPLIVLGIYNNDDDGFIDKYELWEDRNEHAANFHSKMDDYLQFAPAVAVYFMNAIGKKGKHDVLNQSILLLKSELIMNAIVHPLKKYSYILRPDESNYRSFPSGHTAQAFISAELLRKEYGNRYPGLAAAGYLTAIAVGSLRILNNKHWITDVLAGAGIGILSVNLAYLTHRYRWQWGKKKIQFVPTYNGLGPGIYINYSLGK